MRTIFVRVSNKASFSYARCSPSRSRQWQGRRDDQSPQHVLGTGHAMIKKAFAENGIEIAIPTVQVAGGSEGSTPAAARQGLELVQQPATNP